MSGIVPAEGNVAIGDLLFNATSVNLNGSSTSTNYLVLGLFTAPTTVSAGTTWSTVTQPSTSGTGYAEIALTNSGWTVSNSSGTVTAVYATQSFGSFTSTFGPVYGYYIRTTGSTKAGGATSGGTGANVLLAIEVDTATAAPYTFSSGDIYAVTPSITIA
jgi:hypothetical protein